MTSSSDTSHLLRLPRELRDQIYINLFSSCTYEVDKPKSPHRTTLSLLLTTKQLYHEALEFYYKHTTFTFTSREKGVAWLSSIPRPALEKIHNLLFDTNRMYVENNGTHFFCEHVSAQQELLDLKSGLHEHGITLACGVVKASAKRRHPWEDCVVQEREMVLESGEGDTAVRTVVRYFI